MKGLGTELLKLLETHLEGARLSVAGGTELHRIVGRALDHGLVFELVDQVLFLAHNLEVELSEPKLAAQLVSAVEREDVIAALKDQPRLESPIQDTSERSRRTLKELGAQMLAASASSEGTALDNDQIKLGLLFPKRL